MLNKKLLIISLIPIILLSCGRNEVTPNSVINQPIINHPNQPISSNNRIAERFSSASNDEQLGSIQQNTGIDLDKEK